MEILKSISPNMLSPTNPLAWGNKNITVNISLDTYWVNDLKNEMQDIPNAISSEAYVKKLAHDVGATTEMKVTTPKGKYSICFPYINFEDIYLQPELAISTFKKLAKDYLEDQGYDVEFEEGEQEKRLKAFIREQG